MQRIYKAEYGQAYSVPCGVCPDCLYQKRAGWVFRLQQEARHAHSATFLTLTYDPKKMPFSPDGLPTLHLRDLQLFWKKLRKTHVPEGYKLKYIAAGEYTPENDLPHYHAIVFNINRRLLTFPKQLEKVWNNGLIEATEATEGRMKYTLKYIMKHQSREFWKDDDRVKKLVSISNGIGEAFLTREMIKHINELETPYLTTQNGKKILLPDYYRNKALTDFAKARIKTEAWNKSQIQQEKEIQKWIQKAPKEIPQNKRTYWALQQIEIQKKKAEAKREHYHFKNREHQERKSEHGSITLQTREQLTRRGV